jgi:hypothetical protein
MMDESSMMSTTEGPTNLTESLLPTAVATFLNGANTENNHHITSTSPMIANSFGGKPPPQRESCWMKLNVGGKVTHLFLLKILLDFIAVPNHASDAQP